MTSLQDDARVTTLLADHIASDASGKVTALGLGFTYTIRNDKGVLPAQHVLVMIDLPVRYRGTQFSLSVELRSDETGQPVRVPTDTGSEPLRISQVVVAERVQVPGILMPDTVPLRVNFAAGFPTGLAVPGPGKYTWRVELDTQHRPGWDASFTVVGPPPPPVFGGTYGPADIPNIAPPD